MYYSFIFILIQETFLPSNNHVRLVRLFFKHIHYFVSSVKPEMITSPYSSLESSPLDEFKRLES